MKFPCFLLGGWPSLACRGRSFPHRHHHQSPLSLAPALPTRSVSECVSCLFLSGFCLSLNGNDYFVKNNVQSGRKLSWGSPKLYFRFCLFAFVILFVSFCTDGKPCCQLYFIFSHEWVSHLNVGIQLFNTSDL